MKKRTLYLLIILLALCAAAGVLAFFLLPGCQIKKELTPYRDKIDVQADAYPYADTQVPETYIDLTYDGFQCRMPADMQPEAKSMDNSALYLNDNPEDLTILMIQKNVQNPFTFHVADSALSARDWEHYFTKRGTTTPSSFYELNRYLHRMTFDDFSMGKKDAEMFRYMAELKKESVSFSQVYLLETDTYAGFVNVISEPGNSQNHYFWMVELYQKKDFNAPYYVVTISAEHLETLKAVIASIP